MRIGYIVDHRYKILNFLGEGGMANVYEAEDLVLHRKVTLKMLRLDLQGDSKAVDRFRKEANSLTKLSDPHIVKIYDFGNELGIPYLVMEYIKGMDLKSYLKNNYPLSLEKVVDIMQQVLSAVKAAHQMGIIHRDLKPQNILIDDFGKIKVTDFGISIATIESATITKTNTMVGSVHYISPEQARGSIITNQSDIYSLGIILFELLTGRVPYQGETAVSIAVKHYQNKLPSVKSINPKIPQSMENIVLRATAKNLNDRYQTIEEMQRDLKTALLPIRKNEPKWEPEESLQEETKILEMPISQSKQNKEKTKTKKRKFNRHPIALSVGIVGILFIALIFVLSLKVQVPDLRGMNIKEAQEVLLSNNLKLGKKVYQYSNSYLKGQTIKTIPARQATVKRNSKVNIVISKGPHKIKFGSYVGQDYEKVRNKLLKKGTLVSEEKEYSNKVPKGKIISQNVNPDMKVNMYQLPVTFTVSQGIKEFKIRDLSGYTQKSVEDYALEHNLTVIFNEEYSDTVPEGQVISQSPEADSEIQEGSQVTVTISLG